VTGGSVGGGVVVGGAVVVVVVLVVVGTVATTFPWCFAGVERALLSLHATAKPATTTPTLASTDRALMNDVLRAALLEPPQGFRPRCMRVTLKPNHCSGSRTSWYTAEAASAALPFEESYSKRMR